MKLKQGIGILKQGILTRQYRFKKVFALSLLSAIADEQKPIQFVFVDVENYQSPLPPSFVDGRTTFTFASAAQEGAREEDVAHCSTAIRERELRAPSPRSNRPGRCGR